MNKRIQSAPLGSQTPPGHSTINKPMETVEAARLWARNHPDPASVYSRRRNKRGGK
jgi:hypothetical protein